MNGQQFDEQKMNWREKGKSRCAKPPFEQHEGCLPPFVHQFDDSSIAKVPQPLLFPHPTNPHTNHQDPYPTNKPQADSQDDDYYYYCGPSPNHKKQPTTAPFILFFLFNSVKNTRRPLSQALHAIIMEVDPFEARLEFLSLLGKLNASQHSIQKVGNFAMKNRKLHEDLYNCIIEELEQVRTPTITPFHLFKYHDDAY